VRKDDDARTELGKAMWAIFVASYRRFHGNQTAFAKAIGRTKGCVSQCLLGERLPSVRTLERAAKVGRLIIVVGYELPAEGRRRCVLRVNQV
jgi:hypothetical protein